jgi:hypothetical protein
MGYSGVRGKLIYEKNLKLKILCQTPFQNIIANARGEGIAMYVYLRTEFQQFKQLCGVSFFLFCIFSLGRRQRKILTKS